MAQNDKTVGMLRSLHHHLVSALEAHKKIKPSGVYEGHNWEWEFNHQISNVKSDLKILGDIYGEDFKIE